MVSRFQILHRKVSNPCLHGGFTLTLRDIPAAIAEEENFALG